MINTFLKNKAKKKEKRIKSDFTTVHHYIYYCYYSVHDIRVRNKMTFCYQEKGPVEVMFVRKGAYFPGISLVYEIIY